LLVKFHNVRIARDWSNHEVLGPIDLETPDGWPDDLRAYLDQRYDFFLDWETKLSKVTVTEYDSSIYGLEAVLRRCALVGWHCTRLTKDEIASIWSGGMQLPDVAMLHQRVDALVDAGGLLGGLANRLKGEHQADDPFRAGMVWFCFYPPRHAGEHSIERFFRHWGGEALYNTHEDDPETGAAIGTIGLPCIVEALVPIASLGHLDFLPMKVARRYLISRGYRTVEPVNHDGAITCPLPAANIRQVVLFPSPEFIKLTDCDGWSQLIVG
jgi:hypothetical protein